MKNVQFNWSKENKKISTKFISIKNQLARRWLYQFLQNDDKYRYELIMNGLGDKIRTKVNFNLPSCLSWFPKRALLFLPRGSSFPLCSCPMRILNKNIYTVVCLSLLRFHRSLAIRFNVALGELRIEVGNIRVWLHQGNKGSFQLFVLKSCPVDWFEPRMTLDLRCSIFCSNSGFSFLLEESIQKTSEFMTHVWRNVGITEFNLIEEFRSAFGVEGR